MASYNQKIITKIYFSMSIQNKKRNETAQPISFHQLVNADHLVDQYFKQHAQIHQYAQLGLSLLREAIERRIGKQKHYHVAYIKHPRFLSPSQKQAVTPKITETMFPMSKNKRKVYGKPKVDLYQDPEQFNQGANQKQPIQHGRPNGDSLQNQNNEEEQKYLRPKTSKKEGQKTKPKQATKANHAKQKHRLDIESKLSGTNRPLQRYDKVESKIKFLIDRDKQNKKIEKLIVAQNDQISKLQGRQEQLLLTQHQQLAQHELSQSEQSSDQQIHQKIHSLKRIDRANYGNEVLQNIAQLNSQAQKITSNLAYEISSSSSSQSEESSL